MFLRNVSNKKTLLESGRKQPISRAVGVVGSQGFVFAQRVKRLTEGKADLALDVRRALKMLLQSAWHHPRRASGRFAHSLKREPASTQRTRQALPGLVQHFFCVVL